MSRAKPKNSAAVALGRMAAGEKKTFSPEELEKRKRRLAAARARSPHPPKVCACGQPVGSGVGDGLCIECRFARKVLGPLINYTRRTSTARTKQTKGLLKQAEGYYATRYVEHLE